MERYYIATLSAVNRIGHQSVKKLVEVFGSAENVWRADLSELVNAGINQKAAENLAEFRSQHPDAVEKLIEFCNVKKVKICTIYDENYPPILKIIPTAPVMFYYRGELNTNAERISIVGTRNATFYGQKVAKMLGKELAEAGITVVSGAARGIDTFAHEAALKVGRTVAVLGYGINKIPREKRKLLDGIVESGGVVISEFPPNLEGNVGTFPARNKVIAGLSRGVVVVEAGIDSGALLTAGNAAEYSRDVFVVPHDIFSKKGEGCNELLQFGTMLIKGTNDILNHYNFKEKKDAPKVELDATEKLVYEAIPENNSITLDEILYKVEEIEPNEISEIMLRLESKGYVFEKDDEYSRC